VGAKRVWLFIAEDIQREPGVGVDDGLDKGAIVFGLVKDGLSAITTIEDVIPLAADGSSGSSWHASRIKQAGLSVNIRYVSFSLSVRLSPDRSCRLPTDP
jgi:hypothetical protein